MVYSSCYKVLLMKENFTFEFNFEFVCAINHFLLLIKLSFYNNFTIRLQNRILSECRFEIFTILYNFKVLTHWLQQFSFLIYYNINNSLSLEF